MRRLDRSQGSTANFHGKNSTYRDHEALLGRRGLGQKGCRLKGGFFVLRWDFFHGIIDSRHGVEVQDGMKFLSRSCSSPKITAFGTSHGAGGWQDDKMPY